MHKGEVLDLINANPACHLATVEGDVPHTRGIFIYRADENGIVFHTGTMKDLHKQLQTNPKTEWCFNDFQNNIQVRVSGIAGLEDDMELKKEIVENRPFLKDWVESKELGYETLAVYRVRDCVATVWTMETNFAPKSYIELQG